MKSRSGFTLIELAIAIAVVFIGVLALFALITTGLEESGKAVAETQSSMFADSVFNALGAGQQAAAERGIVAGNVVWRQYWAQVAGGSNITITPPAWQTAATPTPVSYDVIARGTHPSSHIRTLVFSNYAHRVAGQPIVVNNALRYSLWVTPPPGAITVPANAIVPVRLQVWDGEFGTTDDSRAMNFYTEFDNPGDL